MRGERHCLVRCLAFAAFHHIYIHGGAHGWIVAALKMERDEQFGSW